MFKWSHKNGYKMRNKCDYSQVSTFLLLQRKSFYMTSVRLDWTDDCNMLNNTCHVRWHSYYSAVEIWIHSHTLVNWLESNPNIPVRFGYDTMSMSNIFFVTDWQDPKLSNKQVWPPSKLLLAPDGTYAEELTSMPICINKGSNHNQDLRGGQLEILIMWYCTKAPM